MKFCRTALLAVVVSACVGTACAARTAQPVSDPARWQGDPRLYSILNVFPLGDAQRDSLAVYAREYVDYMDEQLAQAAEDSYAPSDVRVNALLILSERNATQQLIVFRTALDDDDVRVRAMAVSAMRRFFEIRPEAALQIASMGLQDPSPDVQAQALHAIGEREPSLLRTYMADAASAELRTVALDLLRVAEERGASLAADTTTGTLRRVTTHGFTIRYTPRQRWPQWEAALGDVIIERAGAAPITLTEIEAVAGVVPVFFSPAGDYVVYERDRQIVVRSVATGEERMEGPGVAPRVLPFTNTFVYMRELEQARTEARQQTRLRYEVLIAPFDAGAGDRQVIGSAGAATSFDVHGSYSPVRWMRVEERGGVYYLVGEGMDIVTLPDPFAAAR